MRTWMFVILAACAAPGPPRALVAVHDRAAVAQSSVLVAPTTCITPSHRWCERQTIEGQEYGVDADRIDPLVRLKLELGGYMLVDATTLRLTTAARTEVTHDDRIQRTGDQSSTVDASATVAELSPADQLAAAASLGLTGVLTSTLSIDATGRQIELSLVLFALDGHPVWTSHCQQALQQTLPETVDIVANCAANGVLALRTPDANLVGRP